MQAKWFNWIMFRRILVREVFSVEKAQVVGEIHLQEDVIYTLFCRLVMCSHVYPKENRLQHLYLQQTHNSKKYVFFTLSCRVKVRTT